ncbi:MAG: carbamoyltransferase C-terminal domain-containing protein [Planctomycetota bacterium]
MNGRARELPVPVRPFPVAGDAGAAFGAAAWGPRARDGPPRGAAATLRPRPRDRRRRGRRRPRRVRRARLALDALAEAVAARVAAGRLVGVARGRAELGPRALGGRSVLARADDPAVRDRLNDHKAASAGAPSRPSSRPPTPRAGSPPRSRAGG